MNPHLKNLNKVEFVITCACTGQCLHCSQGGHRPDGGCINVPRAMQALSKVAERYSLHTVLAFGGEPLLFPDAVCELMQTAKALNIPNRQVITNGFFTRDRAAAAAVAESLLYSGVNDLRVSADVFHQRTIPVEAPLYFARTASALGIPTQVQPAWVQSRDADNRYDRRTREITDIFAKVGIAENPGNIVFPEGRARETLREFFEHEEPPNPYVEDPRDVRCLSFDPTGGILGGNFLTEDILDILDNYKP